MSVAGVAGNARDRQSVMCISLPGCHTSLKEYLWNCMIMDCSASLWRAFDKGFTRMAARGFWLETTVTGRPYVMWSNLVIENRTASSSFSIWAYRVSGSVSARDAYAIGWPRWRSTAPRPDSEASHCTACDGCIGVKICEQGCGANGCLQLFHSFSEMRIPGESDSPSCQIMEGLFQVGKVWYETWQVVHTST